MREDLPPPSIDVPLHDRSPSPTRVASRVAAIFGSIVLLLFGAGFLTFALIDRGYLDGVIERTASYKLGRSVHFHALRTNLLSKTPEVRIDGLTIGNPDWIPNGNLAEIGRLTIRLRLWPLLLGTFDMTELRLDRPVLHLIRFGPGRNNWKIAPHPKPGPAFAVLRGVRRFAVTAGILDFHDHARDLFVHGSFANGDADSPMPFRLVGTGTLKGGPVSLRAAGGPIHGDAVGRPYPFVANIVDGKTVLRASGTSGDAFDLTRYALKVAGHGPNLAGIGYMFNLITPNSAPYVASVNASSDGTHLLFDALDVHTGGSHITGRIWSDHSTGRREIRATFDAPTLARGDIDAMLSPVPSRISASSESGAVKPAPAGRWILSDSPVSMRRMRGADFDFNVHIGTLTGYALPLTDIRTRTDLDHGRLDFPHFAAKLYSGNVSGSGYLDASRALPQYHAKLDLSDLHLAQIQPGSTPPPSGRLDMRFDLTGNGYSLHQAAAAAQGSLSLNVEGASIPRKAAWILSGDLLRAAGASLGSKRDLSSLDCATIETRGNAGRMAVQRLALATPLGTTAGVGSIDLGTEQLSIVLRGYPAHRRLFQVAAPVRIKGPWLKPAITIMPGEKARALGLRGPLGVVLTPLAGLLPLGKRRPPPPICHPQG